MSCVADGLGGGVSSTDNDGGDEDIIGMGVDDGALVAGVDGHDDDDDAVAFVVDDVHNERKSVEDDDDYATSELSPALVVSIASSAVPVSGGGGDDDAVIAIDTSMTTRVAPLTEEIRAMEDGVSPEEHSESDDHSTLSSSSSLDASNIGVVGETNAEVVRSVGDTVVASPMTTIACTDDDAIIETKDYNLVRGDEGSNNSNKLVRLLLRRPNYNDDIEREARKEESERAAANARKWNEWMVSGRKVRDGDDNDAEVESSASESASLLLGGVDVSIEGAESEAVAATMITKITPISSSTSDAEIVTFGESSPENTSDQNINESTAIATSPLSPDVINGDRAVAASGGASLHRTSAMNIGKTIVPGIVASPFAVRLKAILRRKPSDDNDDSSRTMIRRKAAAVRVREPGRISASDWRDNIMNMPNSTILRDVQDPVMWVFVWATSWSIVYECLTRLVASAARGAFDSSNVSGGVAGYFSWWGGGVAAATPSEAGWVRFAAWASRRMCLPTLTHSMMVSAMSLLLVFRTNSAYQRFAEGRRVNEFIFLPFLFIFPSSLYLKSLPSFACAIACSLP
jgi:hypothetical protein